MPLEPQEDSKKVSGLLTKGDRQIEELKKTSMATVKSKELQSMEEGFDRHLDESQELKSTEFKVPRKEVQHRNCTKPKVLKARSRQVDESEMSTELKSDSWLDINEVIESDFLISPGDIYPSRKVELKDAKVSKETLHRFEKLCKDQKDAFSKNNRDIGTTQLIEMEIDTGGSVPLAQSL